MKRFNQPGIGLTVPILTNNKKTAIADTEKAKLFKEFFFRGQNIFLESTSVDNMALGMAKGLLHVTQKNNYGRTTQII